jgi:hypothetical protein
MTDTHTEALVERVARAMWSARQHDEPEYSYKMRLGWDDAKTLARAAIEALPARNDERALKLVEALMPFADFSDYLDSETTGFDDSDELELTVNGHTLFGFKVGAFRQAAAVIADTQPSGDTRWSPIERG